MHNHSHRYRVVDVFTQTPLEGNPLAVFPDARGIAEKSMQSIARELNLSETVFVLPPSRSGCAARLRIFTPVRELPFAGHPTIGTAFVLMEEGRIAAGTRSFRLEETVGPIAVRVENGAGDRPLVWLRTPTISEGPVYDRKAAAQALGLDLGDLLDCAPQWLSAAVPVIFVALRDRAAVDRAWLDLSGMRLLTAGPREPACVFVFAPTPEGAYSRMFAPEFGVAEDPATGAATGPLAAYMMRYGLVSSAPGARFISEQGTRMGRRSILHVRIEGVRGAHGIEVGGHVTPLIEASMTLPPANGRHP
jgi:trans-2,3-dihydro-3-hydroxyanthranilate isomerase